MELEGKLHGWEPGVGALDGAGPQVPPPHRTALLPVGDSRGSDLERVQTWMLDEDTFPGPKVPRRDLSTASTRGSSPREDLLPLGQAETQPRGTGAALNLV